MDNEEITTTFSSRLKKARLLKGLSAQEVADGLKVSRQAYSKYENGKSFPNSKMLIDIHNILDVSIDYLFRKTNFNKLDFDFRKKANLSKSKQQQIEIEVEDLIEKRIKIEDVLNTHIESDLEKLSASLAPIKSLQEISLLASALRAQWNLGNEPIKSIPALLENHGIMTVKIEADSSFDGASAKITEYKNRPVVIINSKAAIERQRFTAIHELAHLYLKFGDLEHKEIEKLCHVFANEFILPSPKLNEVFSADGTIYTKEIQSLQAEYGISFDAIVYRLYLAGIISESMHKRYYFRRNKDPKFKEVTEKSLFVENGTFSYEKLVFKALNEELITSSQAAQFLNVSVDELDELGAIN